MLILGLAAFLIAALILSPPETIAILDQNVQQNFQSGRFAIALNDGRQSLGSEGELRFPCLRSIVDGHETWSPPGQLLVSGQRFLIGLSPEDVLTMRLIFVPGRTPIRARVIFETWPVQRPGRSLRLNMRRQDESGLFLGQIKDVGGLIELRGELIRRDERGLVWGREPDTQLRLSLAGQPSWSPPRPLDRTDFAVEYPLACRHDLALTARFVRPSSSDEVLVLLDAMPILPTSEAAASYGPGVR